MRTRWWVCRCANWLAGVDYVQLWTYKPTVPEDCQEWSCGWEDVTMHDWPPTGVPDAEHNPSTT